MKFCIYGAGSIGGSIAARLAQAGQPTSVVARGAHLAAIRERGLTCEAPNERFTVQLPASDDPAQLGPQDVVFVAVKAHALSDIARPLRALLHGDTAVIYALNGIPWWYFHGAGGPSEATRLDRLDPGGLLWDGVGVARTIGCSVNYASSVVAPGVVRQVAAANQMALGEPDGRASERLAAIAEALRQAGFTIDTQSPIRREIWVKLRRLIPISVITSLTLMTAGGAVGAGELRPLFRAAMLEVNAIAAAYGCPLDTEIDAKLDQMRANPHRPSMLQDLEADRSMEIDAQLTVPLEMARAAGVATPTLDVLIALVRARARSAGLYAGER